MRPAEATQREPLGAGSMPGGEQDLGGAPGWTGLRGAPGRSAPPADPPRAVTAEAGRWRQRPRGPARGTGPGLGAEPQTQSGMDGLAGTRGMGRELGADPAGVPAVQETDPGFATPRLCEQGLSSSRRAERAAPPYPTTGCPFPGETRVGGQVLGGGEGLERRRCPGSRAGRRNATGAMGV